MVYLPLSYLIVILRSLFLPSLRLTDEFQPWNRQEIKRPSGEERAGVGGFWPIQAKRKWIHRSFEGNSLAIIWQPADRHEGQRDPNSVVIFASANKHKSSRPSSPGACVPSCPVETLLQEVQLPGPWLTGSLLPFRLIRFLSWGLGAT